MNIRKIRAFVAIVIGISITLVLNIFAKKSPYFLGLGCIIGVFLAKPSSLRRASFYGAMIAIPLGLYFNFFADGTIGVDSLSLGLLNVGLFAGMGGLLGFLSEWTKRQFEEGTILFT